MRSNKFKMSLVQSGLALSAILMGSGAALGQQQVNLTAGPATASLPDGSAVPMWGYSCGAVVSGSTATCAALNKAATTPATWSPVIITVPTGQALQINLTNNLSFGTTPNNIPTSLVIVGQLGGGLGTVGVSCNSAGSPTGGSTCTAAPDHTNAQPLTWPVAADNPGQPLTGVGTPPPQGKRVQSFATEAPALVTTSLTWSNLHPGTYLIESGTHPSIQGPMGLYGILVVTTAPTPTAAGVAYPGVNYAAEVPLLMSEIDPVQNGSVQAAVNTVGFSETMVWSGLPAGCGNKASPTFNQCYPPAVNYTPLYYLFNGVAFDKTNGAASMFPTLPATAAQGTAAAPNTVLVRLVNAGLRMHVPSIVGAQTGSVTGAVTAPSSGFALIAEDGNVLPGVARVQSEVFLAPGKTYDVSVNVPAVGAPALPIFDRELSLSANAISRDAGMLAYISINGAGLPTAASATKSSVLANPDNYPSVIAGRTVTVSDPGKGLIANDIGVTGVTLLAAPTGGTLTLNRDGTFTYVANSTTTSDSFTYCANGSVTAGVCSSGITATVTLAAAATEAASGITLKPDSYASNSTSLSIKSPGILGNDVDAAGYPLTVDVASVAAVSSGLTLSVDKSGAFNASAAPGTYYFTYKAQNSQGTLSVTPTTCNSTTQTGGCVALTFPSQSNLTVTVLDGKDLLAGKTQAQATHITDYRWIIEEDRTFYVDPQCTSNPPQKGCPTAASGIVPTFGTNFHTSYMPIVATGCTGPLSCESGQTMLDPAGSGAHIPAICDLGNGACRPDPNPSAPTGMSPLMPSQVHLDANKRYYFTVLPGDAGNPFASGNLSADCANGVASATHPGACGHGMGGAPLVPACTINLGVRTCTFGTAPALTVLTEPDPYPPSKLSVFVFEDDFPLNGEQDGGGGIDVLSPNEPGLGGFNVTLFDDAGGTGDATGQMTYDMFNQPLVNSLSGTIDPSTGRDACPISANARIGTNPDGTYDTTQTGITGTIVTCPKFEALLSTDPAGFVPPLSPLAGQAVVANLMPGRYGVVATPAADRIGRGEEWLQTNTLDGQKAHDSFLRVGEPSFFQEYGPAGYHVSIGFANPKIINSRLAGVCAGNDPNLPGAFNCNNTVKGKVTTERMSRTPDERLYSSGDNSSFAFTQCYVSFGDPDGEDIAFTKCNPDGTFSLSGLPNGSWRITVFDQWNDMLVDGLSTPVLLGGGAITDLHDIAMNQWQANVYTKSFLDLNGNGLQDSNEPGLTLVPTNIRFRDGSYSNFNNTDLQGNAGFNEVFPLFSWYVIESDSTRYKNTGTHVVYDAGGPADGSAGCAPGNAPCGSATGYQFMANTAEQVSVPNALRVPGAFYCSSADCTDAPTPLAPGGKGGSTGRIDPPWVLSEGWQGFSGQNSFLDFGKKPFAPGENGGIRGEVIYASTRPFDDPQLLIHTSWTPDVPGVTINLYKVGTATDGSQSLTLVDHTTTSSFDDWAQGFRSDGNPNMNCPGQFPAPTSTTPGDLFFFSLFDQPMYLDVYNHQLNGTPLHTVPNDSQYKCYDGMHNWNQLQPAPYDGMYTFPSVTAMDPVTGKPTGTNCTACVTNPDSNDPYRFGTPMLPDGQYVVEMIVPPGYELVKEEDKNILIGDNYIAPVTVQFPGLGSAIYILPDQAEVSAAYNANNAQNSTNTFGRVNTLSSHEGDTGSVESFWPCVGQSRVVPDYISLFPKSKEVAPFAGATRNLCDRKLVNLDDQTSALAKFWVFTSAHVAAHFTGVITDDFTSEFDPFSPQFGEKFSPANLPISIKDWTGQEISRTYSDQWGTYNGLTYSTWEVNPPNPTGYAPQMMVTCMNDPGTGPTPDPLYNPQYSQFCYEIPFMPGQTQYMDTPVVPTSAFAGAGYNNPDCAYPDATPAIKSVNGDGVGPWVKTAGNKITITSLGDLLVPNNGYSGPAATAAPFNLKTVKRHYGFGASRGTLSIGGVNVTANNISTWNDTTIVANVPNGVPACPLQQQAQYGGSNAQCGELSITTAAGKKSIDTVTVTIGGKTPTVLTAGQTIQSAIDAAAPGDLIIVPPGSYSELLLMWKPVRLQGVGAASSVINANTHPAGKLDVWRARVDCLFGLALNGSPKNYDPSCGTGLAFFSPTPLNPQIDRLPLEATVGWDATLNGNLAELLQEPTLMGALEGAAITVLSKGVTFPSDPFASDTFPTGTRLLTGGNSGRTGCGRGIPSVTTGQNSYRKNPFPSNFMCNPSRIDGLGITNSSQGGGGIFVHAWGHNLEISNNRVANNTGTLSGGINVGQGEFPPEYLGGAGAVNADPGSCQTSNVANLQLPYCFDVNVNIHHNAVTSNSSTGDELFSATPAGAGGVSFCTGSDYYQFNYNWVCGNLSTGDGGGVGQLGFVYHDATHRGMEHNAILFNQSTNPTIAANGGGILIMGAPDVDPACGVTTDQDCVPAAGQAPNGPSDGTGPGLVINANLIMGNAAESGSGGGLRLQHINGTDVVNFPGNPSRWNSVNVTNNIIANNVAGWDGAGVALLDALNVNFINNTVMSNDSTASSGVLFNTLGAPLASGQGPQCTSNCGTTSAAQPAGLVAIQHSAELTAALNPLNVTCPAGHFSGTSALNGTCKSVSFPLIENDVFWQNRSFYIGVNGLGAGTLNQQNTVALLNAFTGTSVASEPTTDATTANGNGVVITGGTGACVAGSSYWDIGVRGDSGPTNHGSGFTLAPTYSVLTGTGSGASSLAAQGYAGSNNLGTNPTVLSQYCNGSRTPPEFLSSGYQVPPGISDATVPNPVFNLTPAATVDEGNNWINISWGPLAVTNTTAAAGSGPLGNYALALGSPAIDAGSDANAPRDDFFGTARPQGKEFDIGAVEFAAAPGADLDITPQALDFGAVALGRTSSTQFVTLGSAGTATLRVTGLALTAGFTRATGFGLTQNCNGNGTVASPIVINAGATCRIYVTFTPTTVGTVNGSLTVTSNDTSADAAADKVVTLTGKGQRLIVSPGNLFFVTIGGNFSATQTVTVSNAATTGSTGAITAALSGVTGSGTFQIASSTCTAAGLNPGASCRIRVQYASPAAFSAGSATLAVSDAEPASATVALVGVRLF